MPRREFLTPQKRSQLLAFPSDQAELIHLATLARDDLAFVRQRRGEHNRLGMAFLMVHLHYGRILGEEENRHDNLLSLVTAQLEIAPSVWELYTIRDDLAGNTCSTSWPGLGLNSSGAESTAYLCVAETGSSADDQWDGARASCD